MSEHVRSADDRRRARVERGERRAEPPSPPVEALLALQRDVGNRAVSGLLARDKDEKPPETDGATNTTLGLGELGVLALDAVTWDQNGRDVHIVFPGGPIVPAFMQASASGKHFESAWVSSPSVRSTMKAVFISTAAMTDPNAEISSVTATLNFAEVTHEFVKSR